MIYIKFFCSLQKTKTKKNNDLKEQEVHDIFIKTTLFST